jgi:hypothetical protein
MKRTLLLTAAALAGLSVVTTTAPAQEPDEEAMMAAYMKAATPGAEHEKLAARAGTYTTTTRSWLAPGAPPEETTGSAERSAILGGRYVVEKYNSTMMGMPFEGMGITGYDNVEQKYVTIWVDNMSTGIFRMLGEADDNGNLVFTGEYKDPVSGETKTMRSVSSPAAGGEKFEMYEVAADGSEFKVFEIVYTKATS